MPFESFPSSGGKTSYKVTLTSGTSYTVPAGVTYLNVTLVGGGGGGGIVNTSGLGSATLTASGAGGSTTFTGATTATGGTGGETFVVGAKTTYSASTACGATYTPTANSGLGGGGGGHGFYWASAGFNQFDSFFGQNGGDGTVVTSTLAVTAGASITYAIGAGGTAASTSGYFTNATATAGASGRIEVEYWV